MFDPGNILGEAGTALISTWQVVAEDFATPNGSASKLFADKAVLAKMLAITPSDLLPIRTSMLCSPTNPFSSHSIPPAIQTLTLLVEFLMNVSGGAFTPEELRSASMLFANTSSSNQSSTSNSAQEADQAMSTLQLVTDAASQAQAQTQSQTDLAAPQESALQQLSSGSSLKQELASGAALHCRTHPTPKSPLRLLQLLRSLLLMLKLACLTHVDRNTASSATVQGMFWRTVIAKCDILVTIADQAMEDASDSEQQEIHQLSLLVVRLAVPVFRRYVQHASQAQSAASPAKTQPSNGSQFLLEGVVCLALLVRLVSIGTEDFRLVMANEIFRLGKLVI